MKFELVKKAGGVMLCCTPRENIPRLNIVLFREDGVVERQSHLPTNIGLQVDIQGRIKMEGDDDNGF